MKLETIISKNKESKFVHVAFPITRKELRKRLSSVGIVDDEWIIRGVKTGSEKFGTVVANSKNFDELNFLGYFFAQLDADNYYKFFHLCNVFSEDINSVADCINVASNTDNYFMLRKIRDAEFLGRWCVSEYLKNNDADSLAVWESIGRDFEEIGYRYAAEKHGRFWGGDFYGRTENWFRTYSGNVEDIPEYLLIDRIPI